MKSIYDNYQLLESIMDLIANQFGPNCEVVLHDNTKEYEHTIVDIRNGQVSGRKIGDGGGAWGLEVMANENMDNHRYNKVMITDDERVIRNSSVFFKNDNGENIGSLCINFDITSLVNLQSGLNNYTLVDKEENKEKFVNDVNEILDLLIEECKKKFPTENLTKEQKQEIVKYLDSKGAFLITKSGDKVCDYLQISKFTLYSYLDTVRKN